MILIVKKAEGDPVNSSGRNANPDNTRYFQFFSIILHSNCLPKLREEGKVERLRVGKMRQ